ncbi:Hypothetical protein NGAL_HAMBI2605_46750 [Neorhizobium galegae bv. orientalis]|nr:Hypothetical protein NGAL_HAMBI2605_46750 [Neorhizobium galegae bv. orientalis]
MFASKRHRIGKPTTTYGSSFSTTCAAAPVTTATIPTKNIPYLLLRDGTGVGTARLDRQTLDLGIVRLVAILPEFQRQGLGRRLLREIEDASRKMALTRLTVHAAPDAVDFYRKLGWTLADESTDDPILVKILD